MRCSFASSEPACPRTGSASLAYLRTHVVLLLLAAFAPQRSATSAEGAPTITYRLDCQASHMLMHTFTEGLLSSFVPDYTFAFTSFSGTLTLTADTLVPASFAMRTEADSIRLTDRVSEEERRERERMLREEILETDTYPEMLYRSTGISMARDSAGSHRASIEGTLTQHGVTRSCPMTVSVTFPDGGDRPGETIRLRGEFSIRQSDYGITPMTFVFGTVRVTDRVVISFDLVARRQEG